MGVYTVIIVSSVYIFPVAGFHHFYGDDLFMYGVDDTIVSYPQTVKLGEITYQFFPS